MLRIAKTENGLVQGLPGSDARNTVFKGIPFAANTSGENRWRPPQPAENWEGIRPCFEFAPITMQRTPGLDPEAFYAKEWHVDSAIPMSEDGSLALNIWTPAKREDEKLPVMVWIFGGGLQEGYSCEMEFDGEGFNSILVVNPGRRFYDPNQYRLGIVEKVKAFGDQKNPHHTLSLFEHCQKCGEIAFEEYGHHFPAIAAAIHDYGKIYTQSFDEAGVAHYYQHEAYSAYLALSMGFGLEISQLVCYHMMPYAYKGGEATWRARLGEVLWGLIEMLHDCDVRAH